MKLLLTNKLLNLKIALSLELVYTIRAQVTKHTTRIFFRKINSSFKGKLKNRASRSDVFYYSILAFKDIRIGFDDFFKRKLFLAGF